MEALHGYIHNIWMSQIDRTDGRFNLPLTFGGTEKYFPKDFTLEKARDFQLYLQRLAALNDPACIGRFQYFTDLDEDREFDICLIDFALDSLTPYASPNHPDAIVYGDFVLVAPVSKVHNSEFRPVRYQMH